MTNSSTPNVNVTVSNLDADKQVKLQNISGSLKVRLLIKGGKTKYFGIKTLTITADVIEDVRETHTITANVTDGQTSFGTIDNTGANDVVDGGAIALTAIANEGYGFVGWTKASDSSWTSTDNPLSLNNVTSDETYTAIFKKLYTVTYNMDGYILTNNKALNNYDASKSINEKYAGADDKYTIPAYSHYYMYRPEYIFSNKWEDQDGNQYDKGSEITLTKDITLTPVWTATTQTLDNSVSATSVTWNFKKATILFNSWQGTTGYYTKPLTVNGELIAVPMIIDATSGKVDNSGRTDNLAQTNVGTKFTIPAVKGMTVTIANAYTAFSTTTVAGSTDYELSNSDKTLTYTYNGDAETIDIVIGEDKQYLTSIAVNYPAITSKTISPAYEKSTYVTTVPLDFSAVNGLKAYVATKAEAGSGSVTLSEVGAVPAKTPLMLIGTAGTEYTVPVAASATAPETNLFLAGDGTTVFDGSTYDFILYSDGLFYQIGSGTVATTKAYLHCESDPRAAAQGARGLSIVFEDETTGIGASLMNSERVNNEVYNLNGQRVMNPAKGLYIVNGKKVVIK